MEDPLRRIFLPVLLKGYLKDPRYCSLCPLGISDIRVMGG